MRLTAANLTAQPKLNNMCCLCLCFIHGHIVRASQSSFVQLTSSYKGAVTTRRLHTATLFPGPTVREQPHHFTHILCEVAHQAPVCRIDRAHPAPTPSACLSGHPVSLSVSYHPGCRTVRGMSAITPNAEPCAACAPIPPVGPRHHTLLSDTLALGTRHPHRAPHRAPLAPPIPPVGRPSATPNSAWAAIRYTKSRRLGGHPLHRIGFVWRPELIRCALTHTTACA